MGMRYQPQGQARLDRNTPIGRDIVFSVQAGTGLRDVVRGYTQTGRGTAQSVKPFLGGLAFDNRAVNTAGFISVVGGIGQLVGDHTMVLDLVLVGAHSGTNPSLGGLWRSTAQNDAALTLERSGADTLLLSFRIGGNSANRSFDIAASSLYGKRIIIAVSIRRGLGRTLHMRVACDGVILHNSEQSYTATDSSDITPTGTEYISIGSEQVENATRNPNALFYAQHHIGRVLESSEVAELSANQWQLYEDASDEDERIAAAAVTPLVTSGFATSTSTAQNNVQLVRTTLAAAQSTSATGISAKLLQSVQGTSQGVASASVIASVVLGATPMSVSTSTAQALTSANVLVVGSSAGTSTAACTATCILRTTGLSAGLSTASAAASIYTAPPVLDTTEPAIPGVLSITNITSSGFTVGWQAGTDNVGIAGYEVSVDTGTPSYVDVGMVLTRVVTGLPGAATRTVRVRAYDAANNKSTPLTTTATTSTPIDSAEPIWAVGSVITITNITATGFTASWPAATDNIGVVDYEVSADTGIPAYVSVGTARTKTYATLVSGTAHTVRVRAVDAAMNASAPITIVATTSGSAPVGPPATLLLKVSEAPIIQQLTTLSPTVPTVITYKNNTGQELVLFNNSASTVVANLKGSAAGLVTTKGLAGVTADLSGGLPISVPAKQFVVLKLDNAVLYLKGDVTLTAASAGTIFAGILQQA